MEQTVQHRQSEVLAGQRKLDEQQVIFKTQTARLLEEQRETLMIAAEPFKTELSEIQSTIEDQKLQIDINTSILKQQTIDMSDLQEPLAVNLATLKSANIQLKATKAENNQLSRENVTLKTGNEQLESQKTELEVAIRQLMESTKPLQAKNDSLIERNAELETEYEQKITEKEYTIELLDAKVLKQTQDMEENSHNEEKTRKQLADWKKELDAKDSNLRIREAKVAMGEGKLIQNSNLLNL